jgi:serine/threonine protein kinase
MSIEWQRSEVIVISDDLKVSFWLRKDKDKIILDKLGDGTYSSVYRGRIETGLPADVAIKLLYDNNAIRPRQISDLNKQELDALIDPLAEQYGKDPTKIKEAIVRHRNSGYKLWEKLREAYGPSDKTDSASEKPDFDKFMEEVSEQVSSSAVHRFRQEQFVTENLMESSRLRFGVAVTDTKGVVKVLDGTDTFLSALDASSDLKSYFHEIEPITVSDYALVMDLYSFSLKDLLERPIIDKDSRTDKDNKTGYEMLRTLPHKQRIREALIILKGVADGVEKLHNVKISENNFISLFHRDIKPGNIFIRRISTEAFEVALGDLGNLPFVPGSAPSAKIEHTLFRPPDYEYAPGTQSYRSPEQKYYMDVADVEVVICPKDDLENRVRQILNGDANTGSASSYGSDLDHDHAAAATGEPINNADDNGPSRLEATPDARETSPNVSLDDSSSGSDDRAVLIVRDPKFRSTLIEENDFVIFSRDTERKRHPIKQCIPRSVDRRKNESGYWGFVLDVDLEDTRIKIDKKTQVEFYKTQSYRTDLFGIGAVMFDMITVGASPEQFYESIRKYEGQSIDTIVNRYDTLTRGELEAENPDFIEIFRPFRNHNNPSNPYPDKEIVEFILKCMLYQSEGTFFLENINEPRKASQALKSRMEELRVKYTREYLGLSEGKSILVHNLEPGKEPRSLSVPFNQRIDELQGLAEWPDNEQLDTPFKVANRLMFGTYYFWRVVDFVRGAIPVGNQSDNEERKQETGQIQEADSLRLLQVLPTFISLQLPANEERKRAQLVPSALSIIDLLKELRENRLELLIRSASNAFVPNEIASMRRDIRLLPSENAGTTRGEKVTCKYGFRDSATVSRAISEGDWIIIGSQLWKVVRASSGNELEIELPDHEGRGASTEEIFEDNDKYVDATYFSRVDPLKYYLEMLGLYLQQLVFTYSPITTTTRDRVDIRGLLRAFEIGPPFCIFPLASQSNSELRGIHECCAHMLVKLTLHEAENSYYANIISRTKDTSSGVRKLDATMFNQIHRDAEELYGSVMKMLGITDYVPEDHPRRELIKSSEDLPSEFKDSVDELINARIDIEKIIKRSGLIEGEDLSGS